jgi:hypothetical protein
MPLWFKSDSQLAVTGLGLLAMVVAISTHRVVRDLIAGKRAVIEDRYAIGDRVVLRAGRDEVRGALISVGALSICVRTDEGYAWHAGHASVNVVTNLSQFKGDEHKPKLDTMCSSANRERSTAEKLVIREILMS